MLLRLILSPTSRLRDKIVALLLDLATAIGTGGGDGGGVGVGGGRGGASKLARFLLEMLLANIPGGDGGDGMEKGEQSEVGAKSDGDGGDGGIDTVGTALDKMKSPRLSMAATAPSSPSGPPPCAQFFDLLSSLLIHEANSNAGASASTSTSTSTGIGGDASVAVVMKPELLVRSIEARLRQHPYPAHDVSGGGGSDHNSAEATDTAAGSTDSGDDLLVGLMKLMLTLLTQLGPQSAIARGACIWLHARLSLFNSYSFAPSPAHLRTHLPVMQAQYQTTS